MEPFTLALGSDGQARCWWACGDPEYEAYHDHEWGQPQRGEAALFELLSLEAFQSGLAWITILRKREGFRRAFAGWDVARVASFGPADVERLVGDAGIVRHRGKIEATVANAQAVAALQARGETLADLVWSFAPPPRAARLAPGVRMVSTTPESTALSKELRRLGLRFVGPTTVYAFMQAAGLVDDHLAGCPAGAG